MKALRLRKTLWVTNLVLGAGIAGVGALYVLQKPAKADVAVGKKTLEEYRQKQPKPVLVPPVKEEDIKGYVLKPEWKDLPYFPYAGPKIPSPKAKVVDTKPVEEGPKDLEATGRVYLVVYDAKASSVSWEFSNEKKTRANFFVGEWVRVDDKAPERFKLVDVIRDEPAPFVSRYRILYDVYEKGPDPATARRAELRWDTEPKDPPRDIITLGGERKPVASGAAGGVVGPESPGKPAAGTPAGTGVVAPPAVPSPEPVAESSADWGPEKSVDAKTGERTFLWTERTAKRFAGKKADEVLNEVLKNVRTENYDKGGVRGIQVFPAENDEMAQAFDVRRGDVLVSINGQPVKSKDDAIRIAKALPPDTARVSVVIDRLGRLITYTVDPRDPKTRRAAATLNTR